MRREVLFPSSFGTAFSRLSVKFPVLVNLTIFSGPNLEAGRGFFSGRLTENFSVRESDNKCMLVNVSPGNLHTFFSVIFVKFVWVPPPWRKCLT